MSSPHRIHLTVLWSSVLWLADQCAFRDPIAPAGVFLVGLGIAVSMLVANNVGGATRAPAFGPGDR